MYQFIPLHSFDFLNKVSLNINVVTNEGNTRNESDTEQRIKLEQLFKVCFEYDLNSWPDSSVG